MIRGKNNKVMDRVLPQSPDIERAVLGAMLLEKKAIGTAIEIKLDDCFYKPAHSVIYRTITDLYDENLPVDQLMVSERLKQRGMLDMVGGEATIASLVSETASAANIRYHCQILKEKALLRKMISITTSTRDSCFEDSADPTAILDNLEQGIMNISEMRLSQSYVALEDTVHKAHAEIVRKAETKDGITGVDTGFQRLNDLTAGWQPSDLVIIAGRPSMGKTALATEFAKNAASKNIPVGIFSLEMSVLQLVMRMLFNEGRFDGSTLHLRKHDKGDWTRLSDACSRLNKYPIFIDDTPALSCIELSAKAKRLKAERDIGLIIVDYMQLMQGTTRESRQQEISSISRSLKSLAKELSIPVVALSQLSRALEQRGGDHRPLLSDLRESGAIEQDADLVMFIYRASVYGIDPEYTIQEEEVPKENVAELIIRKQRNGPIGTILLHWIKEYTKFCEFSYESTDEYF
ncbi:MAG TPA: replicative DNA helicase [Anaerolineae bacterium]|nr:replicative DNA helicase [Anaerolineae bacterium]